MIIGAVSFACPRAADPPPVPHGPLHFELVAPLSERADPTEDGAVDFAFLSGGSGEYFVFYRDGVIEHRDAANAILGKRKLDVRRRNECGGFSLEVDPAFAANHLVYAAYCVPAADVDLVSFTWSDVAPESLPRTELRQLFTWKMGGNDFHNFGDLGWDGDQLWLTYGDGNSLTTSQDTRDLRGKLLRITPHRDGTPGYDIPPDNPFVGSQDVAPEVIAWGLKSVFRASRVDRTWYLAEVGLDHWEEISVVEMYGVARNLGHPRCEGPVKLDQTTFDATDAPCDLQQPELVAASLEYSHDPRQQRIEDDPLAVHDSDERIGFSIIGGPVYRGPRYGGAMDGFLVYTDLYRGFVRRARADGATLSDDQHLAHLAGIRSFALAPDGFLYAMTSTAVFRLTD